MNATGGREGPCANPGCCDPDASSGQWQYVPKTFVNQNGIAGRCVCKKADCLRWCGLKSPKQRPGPKRKADDPDATMEDGKGILDSV